MHVPVLLKEMVHALQPRSGGIYLDGTLGAGGYALAILEASAPDGRVVALDLDPDAVARSLPLAQRFGERFCAVHGGFHQAAEILSSLGLERLDGAVLDLGLSSDQLEDPQRGFSIRNEGPLDMRFDTTAGETLLDYLEHASLRELERILAEYGEERHARKVARAVTRSQDRGELRTTRDLAEVVRHAIPGPRSKIHPATRAFQALRIAVNRELERLAEALRMIPPLLRPGGRFCVVSYHSLEDRMVKTAFRDFSRNPGQWSLVTRKPLRPSAEEVQANPRSRSARMRVLEALGEQHKPRIPSSPRPLPQGGEGLRRTTGEPAR